MRTVGEIIDSVKSGQQTTHDECVYALLAMNALAIFDSQALMKLAEKDDKPFGAKMRWEESFRRWKLALGKDAKEWVGWNNDPKNPEYQKMRRAAVKVFESVASSSPAKNAQP